MMKNATVAWLALVVVLGVVTATTLIRSGRGQPETIDVPCGQVREVPADRQRQAPTILRAYPEGRQSPFLLPHYLHEVDEKGDPRTT